MNFLTKFWTYIGKANSEDNKNPSSLRVNTMYLVWTFVSCIAFGFIWVTIFWHDLIIAYLGILAGLVTAAFGWKKWQKDSEEKVDSSKNNSNNI